MVARWRWLVVAVWVPVLVVCALVFPLLEDRLTGMDFEVTGSESSRVDQLLRENFPQLGSESDVVVFESPDRRIDSGESRAGIGRVLAAVSEVAGVQRVESPFVSGLVSPDGRVAVAVVGLAGDMSGRSDIARQVQSVVANSDELGIAVGVTGYSPVQNDATDTQNADVERAESIGIPVALVLLVLALGAAVAALVPVAVALAGIAVAAGAMFAMSSVVEFDSLSMAMATMIGIGVGIDYAMFIVSRYREELVRAGVTDRGDRNGIAQAAGRALATAGKTIIASGIIVMISLCALVVLQAPIFRGIALGVATAVTAMLAVGLTLLPAILAVLGPAVGRGALPTRFQPAELSTDEAVTTGRWARWARVVMARPVLFAGAAVTVLAVATLPLSGIRYGLDMGTSTLSDTPSGQAAATLAAHFPVGALAPVEVVATGPDSAPLSAGERNEVTAYLAELAEDDRIAAILPAMDAGDAMSASVIAAVPFDSSAAIDLVREMRSAAAAVGEDGGPRLLVGGTTAEFVDLDSEMSAKLPIVIALVLVTSLLFLIVAFRSVALPIKAIVMNLLATGAALGITVAVFQWGLGEDLLHFTSPGFVQTYLPTLVFVVLFGLSMDYEVFLIRRIREYWDSGATNRDAVAAGLTHTARPITAAAAIMIVVFGSFLTADVLELKQIGFALAVAVAIDAIIVRLVLVPALMQLFGRWNWWLPAGRHRSSDGRDDQSISKATVSVQA